MRFRNHQQIAHDQLAQEYLKENPMASECEAYNETSAMISRRVQDIYWERVDEGRQRAKDGEL